jgi:hypothetical protein
MRTMPQDFLCCLGQEWKVFGQKVLWRADTSSIIKLVSIVYHLNQAFEFFEYLVSSHLCLGGRWDWKMNRRGLFRLVRLEWRFIRRHEAMEDKDGSL